MNPESRESGYCVRKPSKGPTDKELAAMIQLQRMGVAYFHKALQRLGNPEIGGEA